MALFNADGLTHRGLMTGLYLDPATATALAIPGGEPASKLHITLCYCGDIAEIGDLPIARAVLAADRVATFTKPFTVTATHAERFPASEESDWLDVVVLRVSSNELLEMRAWLAKELESCSCPPKKNFEFKPHITVAYIEPTAPMPEIVIPKEPIYFTHLTVRAGHQFTHLNLGPKPIMLSREWHRERIDLGNPHRGHGGRFSTQDDRLSTDEIKTKLYEHAAEYVMPGKRSLRDLRDEDEAGGWDRWHAQFREKDFGPSDSPNVIEIGQGTVTVGNKGGIIHVHAKRGAQYLSIANVVVKQELRGQGYGKDLYRRALVLAKQIGLKGVAPSGPSSDAEHVWDSFKRAGKLNNEGRLVKLSDVINMPDISDVSFPSMIGAVQHTKPNRRRRRVKYGKVSLSRRPTEFEERVLSLSAIPDRFTEEMERTVEELRTLRIDQLSLSALQEDQDVVSDAAKAILLEAAARMARYGAMEVRQECRRQGVTLSLSGDDDDALAWVNSKIEHHQLMQRSIALRADTICRHWQEELSRSAVRLSRVKKAGLFVEHVTPKAVNGLKTSVRTMLHEAFGFGRRVQVLALIDPAVHLKKPDDDDEQILVDYVVQTAILDQSVCAHCEAMDGATFEYGSEEQEESEPPFYLCDGGDNCRCLQLFVVHSWRDREFVDEDEDFVVTERQAEKIIRKRGA